LKSHESHIKPLKRIGRYRAWDTAAIGEAKTSISIKEIMPELFDSSFSIRIILTSAMSRKDKDWKDLLLRKYLNLVAAFHDKNRR